MPFPTVVVTPGTGATINTLPNAGAATSANSLPVVLATDQSTVPVSGAVTVSGAVAVTGAFYQATQPVSNASLPLPAGASTEATLAALSAKVPAQGQALAAASTPVVLTAAQITALTPLATVGVTGAFFQATQPVSLAAAVALAAGSAVVGRVGIDQTTPGTTNAVQLVPGVTGGWTPARVKAAATTNATSVKASPGQVGGYALFNNATGVRCVKFYDLAAAPTVGTSAPLFTVILQPASGANVSFPGGLQFAAGIAYAVTAGVPDSDATATAADDVHGVVLFK